MMGTLSVPPQEGENGPVERAADSRASGTSLNASRLTYQLTQSPRAIPGPNSPELWAQGEATDHMILAHYDAGNGGWAAPTLVPYGPLSIMPTAATLHYATQCFEGMKLYRGIDGELRLLRPRHNAERMRKSAARVSLPDFPADQLVELIAALAATDAPRWLPRTRPGTYLYVRPTLIATQPSLAIKKASEALLYILLVCFPDFDQPSGSLGPPPSQDGKQMVSEEQRAGLRLLASHKTMVRAWPGGFGDCKVGANYGPSIVASASAAEQGFDQILWLIGSEEWVTEAGACNFFAVVKPKGGTGKSQLLTASLDEGVVLPGVTRASILELADTMFASEVEVVERKFSIHELLEAAGGDNVVECFVAGTAFFITSVGEIGYNGGILKVPVGGDESLSKRLRERLWAIMHGAVEHPWAYKIA
ncbi:hypothetical protein BST61_g4194 [Cercospora zeina]